MIPYIRDIKIHTGRIMEFIRNTAAAPTHIIGTYAPHQGPAAEGLRQPYWDKLTKVTEDIPKTHCKLLFGGLNTRLEAILQGEEQIIGPKLFGRGVTALPDLQNHGAQINLKAQIDHMF